MNNNRWNSTSILTLAGLILLLLVYISSCFIASKTGYDYLSFVFALFILIIAIVYTVLVAQGKIVRHEPDYRQLFIMGIIFLPLGLGSENTVFLVISLTFIIIGLFNKNKWKPAPKWSELPPTKRNLKITLMIILGLIIILTFLVWYLTANRNNQPQITNNQEGIAPYDSGVTGKVLLGPICPVMREPPEPNCADKAYQTTVQVILLNSPRSSSFATVETDKEGKYTVMLPPGEYGLQPIGNSPFPRCETKNVVIEPKKILEADLLCDTGIR
jgi:hypothetical protein